MRQLLRLGSLYLVFHTLSSNPEDTWELWHGACCSSLLDTKPRGDRGVEVGMTPWCIVLVFSGGGMRPT